MGIRTTDPCTGSMGFNAALSKSFATAPHKVSRSMGIKTTDAYAGSMGFKPAFSRSFGTAGH
jgi:hypothetical protein